MIEKIMIIRLIITLIVGLFVSGCCFVDGKKKVAAFTMTLSVVIAFAISGLWL